MTDVFDLSGAASLKHHSEVDAAHISSVQYGVSAIALVDSSFSILHSLPSLLNQAYIREILLVDVGMSDMLSSTLTGVAEEFGQVKILRFKGKSSGEALNLAAKKSVGHYLMFIEAGVNLPSDTCEQLVDAGMLAFEGNWVVCAAVNALPSKPLQGPKQALKQALLRNTKDSLASYSEHVNYLSQIQKGCFLLARSVFFDNDGFDPACELEARFADFSMRLHMNGGSIYQKKTLRVGYPKHHKANRGSLSQAYGWVKYYFKHYRQSSQRRWLYPLTVVLILQGIMRSCLSWGAHLFERRPSLNQTLKNVTRKSKREAKSSS